MQDINGIVNFGIINVLIAKDVNVRIVHDITNDTYSIGVRTTEDFQWKLISAELYNLLKEELEDQEGKRF